VADNHDRNQPTTWPEATGCAVICLALVTLVLICTWGVVSLYVQ